MIKVSDIVFLQLLRRIGGRILLLLILMTTVFFPAQVFGATEDYSGPDGLFFLGNEAGNNGVPKYDAASFESNFYMIPAVSSTVNANNYLGGDAEKPLITTLKSFSSNNISYTYAIWQIQAATGDDAGYFYIRHLESGKYLMANDNTAPAKNRRRVNLGPVSNPGDDCLFKIQTDDGGGTYYISSKTKNDGENKYLNPSKANLDYPNATSDNGNTGGILGFWKEKTTNSAWHFVPAHSLPDFKPAFAVSPDISYVTISSGQTGAIVYYTMGAYDYEDVTSEPDAPVVIGAGNITGTPYSEGSPIMLTYGKRNVIKAIAVITVGGVPCGSLVSRFEVNTAIEIDSWSDITDPNGDYILSTYFTGTGTPQTPGGEVIGSFEKPFKGNLDGRMVTVISMNGPIFEYIEDATIKNVIIRETNVSGGISAGAICNNASGNSRIYNCGVLGGSVSGSGYVGGLVGVIKDYSRVINCYSYADITGGDKVGGIVGYNNYASANDDIRTMVMNCMFYGDISGGTDKAPIYNGSIISNAGNKGLANYNFYWSGCTFTGGIDTYNCALAADEKYLTRFELYRRLLNSNGELAAWYATGSTENRSKMCKWVLLPENMGTDHPFPVLAPQGKYPSVVNYDAENATVTADMNKGGKLGELTVNIQMGSGGAQFEPPTGASISTSSLTLNITDKDYDHFNYNYGKVQLPYYNDVGTGNYTSGRVVTGWKIVNIIGGTAGSFTTGSDVTTDAGGDITATPYNFADRKSKGKDLYGTSGRVFSQGAYWDVPDGVTSITIEPYWGKSAFLADMYWNVVYDVGHATAYNVEAMGMHYDNNKSYNIAGSMQKVYNSLDNAVNNGLAPNAAHSVYDYAVVLVGNYHLRKGSASINNGSKPFTVMSADMDKDNEPDYSFILQFSSRQNTAPIRFDFINIPGLGMAQKSTGATTMPNVGIFKPKGWFEITNTATIILGQFEYDNMYKVAAPLILHGGVIEQIVSNNDTSKTDINHTQYIHVGSNVWFANFMVGIHQDKNFATQHVPVSVTGGEYSEFHLTGTYRADAANFNDNAECYIHGGKLGVVTGAGLEGIGDATNHTNGNITWLIDRADIDEFYGGGLNAAKPIQGNIYTEISNSNVTLFCGGPKFGDMQEGRTVTTKATDCTFGTFYGAGFGGNSYNRYSPTNKTNATNYEWNTWVNSLYKFEYSDAADKNGISTEFDYEFIPMSGGLGNNVARLFVNYVSFSLATTHNVKSTLTGCTVTGDFFGGGNLGKVNGSVTSTLTDCTMMGSVFGAGYSATLPNVDVMNPVGFQTEPYYDTDAGIYSAGVFPGTTPYEWEHAESVDANNAIDNVNKKLRTTEDLTSLGTVVGDVSLTINGATSVDGSVYGGGDSGPVGGSTTVNVSGSAMVDNVVFGGGNMADVGGSVTVNISGSASASEVYGGGALANTNINNATNYGAADESIASTSTNTTAVNLTGGTVGNVYGGGLGDAGHAAMVYGDVAVLLDGAVFNVQYVGESANRRAVSGRLFGCNNVNGTPKGTVTVTVERTVSAGGKPELGSGIYEVAAVYGGGNEAEYLPYSLADAKTVVIINGCDDTSIEYVYGGGNAASVPATDVTVNGCYEIGWLFGGGNGKDKLSNGSDNPGANVGYHAYVIPDGSTAEEKAAIKAAKSYGKGTTTVRLFGGKIHKTFGGSNTLGNVRVEAGVFLDKAGDCALVTDEVIGAGNEADMDGKVKVDMGCVDYLDEIYGGAYDAELFNDVVLNIQSGTYGRVFGGNNRGGMIHGTITVNIEETGCKPLVIGQLYGGGNEAAYITPEGRDGPTVNIKSFTSIGEVYGGGLGESAYIKGDVHVYINEAIITSAILPTDKGHSKQAFTGTELNLLDGTSITPPSRAADENGAMGVIGVVYGGGNAAEVDGDTYVNIGTVSKVLMQTILVDDDGDPLTEEVPKEVDVAGADIVGNVYGGGNKAAVTGSTHIKIGPDPD